MLQIATWASRLDGGGRLAARQDLLLTVSSRCYTAAGLCGTAAYLVLAQSKQQACMLHRRAVSVPCAAFSMDWQRTIAGCAPGFFPSCAAPSYNLLPLPQGWAAHSCFPTMAVASPCGRRPVQRAQPTLLPAPRAAHNVPCAGTRQ